MNLSILKNRASSQTLIVVMLFLFTLQLHCGSNDTLPTFENGVLATAAPIATLIGEQVFKSGGNAFDVAVAVGFSMAVVHPQAGNIGGGGFAVIHDGKSGEVKALDFREKAPAAAHERMYLDSDGSVIEDLSTIGAKAVGVPGTVAGLYELWKEYGSIEWSDLIRISASLADTGFVIDQFQSKHFDKYKERISRFRVTSDYFFPNGKTIRTGERLTQKDLGHTLSLIAAGGPDSFYVGSIADSLVATMQRHNGIITHEDLKSYSVVWRTPITVQIDSFDLFSMPPPSSGGIVVGQILKVLQNFDMNNLSPDSARFIHLFSEASRLAFADRSKHLGDPDFYELPEFMLEDDYLLQRASLIDIDHANVSQDISPGKYYHNESKETTHISVADKDGNLVAITYTLNSSYGSKLAVRGCGFLLNNEMDDFAIAPGHANLYGLVGDEANKVEPNKRMLSSMSPTIVMKNKKPFLILGSPGGSEIITAVAQTILYITQFNLSPKDALEQPRIHHQWLPDVLKIEKNKFDIHVKQALIKFGHNIKEYEPDSEVQLILIDDAGKMSGVSDPRKNGRPGGF